MKMEMGDRKVMKRWLKIIKICLLWLTFIFLPLRAEAVLDNLGFIIRAYLKDNLKTKTNITLEPGK
jgi:hypothetical protein